MASSRELRPEPERAGAPQVSVAYDGSTLLMRLLRIYGWGPLLNLGYYRVRDLPWLVSGLRPFQEQLARQAIALVEPQPGDHVLEVACGQGWTARELARSGAEVLGIDLLPAHIERARRDYGGQPRLRFAVGDGVELALGDFSGDGTDALRSESIDKLLCLEAGFHFGPAGRRRFLERASEVLKPGGRLVLVDFVWSTPHPEEIGAVDPDRLVRDTWQFEQFEPLERYREIAREYGLREARLLDWSRPVTAGFQQVAYFLLAIGRSAAGRLLLSMLRGGGFEYGKQDWERIRDIIQAHDRVRSRSAYVALVLEKPRSAGLDARLHGST